MFLNLGRKAPKNTVRNGICSNAKDNQTLSNWDTNVLVFSDYYYSVVENIVRVHNLNDDEIAALDTELDAQFSNQPCGRRAMEVYAARFINERRVQEYMASK